MNILKHMEAVFVAVALVAVPASYLVNAAPDAHTSRADAAIASGSKVAVVTVTAKRLSVEEKKAELLASR